MFTPCDLPPQFDQTTDNMEVAIPSAIGVSDQTPFPKLGLTDEDKQLVNELRIKRLIDWFVSFQTEIDTNHALVEQIDESSNLNDVFFAISLILSNKNVDDFTFYFTDQVSLDLTIIVANKTHYIDLYPSLKNGDNMDNQLIIRSFYGKQLLSSWEGDVKTGLEYIGNLI